MAPGARTFVTTATALGVTFLLAFIAHYGPGGLRARLDAHLAFWPQKWVFFTELDRDVVTGYRVADGTGDLTAFDDSWYAGFSRTSHARAQEMRLLARQVPDEYWQVCAGVVGTRCTEPLDNSRAFQVTNHARRTQLCGRVAIAVERPSHPERADLIAFVDLVCPK
ncbi:hypothetical protein [Lentzea sp. NPDC004782]|uniref:hypothetical protein n=1 Tax=Lentzea sp. NPDC004782 TaxID=3154458 RepID=UPI00339FE9B0